MVLLTGSLLDAQQESTPLWEPWGKVQPSHQGPSAPCSQVTWHAKELCVTSKINNKTKRYQDQDSEATCFKLFGTRVVDAVYQAFLFITVTLLLGYSWPSFPRALGKVAPAFPSQ